MSRGTLYLVPTPIGNRGDISRRALEVLGEVDLVLCEDTRRSGQLLRDYALHKPLQSHHKFNEHQSIGRLVGMLEEGKNIALVSDAGTPGISDPGFLVVRAALAAGLNVEALPGPTALIPALVQSGIPCDRFCFEGFLPVKKGRQTRLQELAQEPRTMVLYESPHRLLKTLEQLAQVCGADRTASVSRELSKKFSETVRGSLSHLHAHFQKNEPRGEFVIVLAGR
jgi:16S rRNA (cytidine1402-2'-O)-methyltransferase